MTIVINLLSGPGAGKSTNAAGLFSAMKRKYYNVEYVQEYAKDLTWDQRHNTLGEQDYILAKQNQRQRRLLGKVDYIITDGSLLLSTIYVPPDYYIRGFKDYVMDVFNSYNNINFYLTRTKKYVPIGRNQTESQARDIDGKVFKILVENRIPYHEVVADDDCPKNILSILEAEIKKDLERS